MSGIPNGMQRTYRQQYVEQVNQHVGFTSLFFQSITTCFKLIAFKAQSNI